MIASTSSSLKRKCLPMKVHGITRAAAFFRSQDSGTFSSSAASAGVCNRAALTGRTPIRRRGTPCRTATTCT